MLSWARARRLATRLALAAGCLLALAAAFVNAFSGAPPWASRPQELAHAGTLHALHAGGRFGNKVFQQLAVSELASRHNIAAAFQFEAEFLQLGIPLRSGSRRMHGPRLELTEDLLQECLEANSSGPPPGRTLTVNGFYQTPWFAEYLWGAVFHGRDERSIAAANPWRGRFDANNDTFVHMRLGDVSSSFRGAGPFLAAIRGHPPSSGGRVYLSSDSPAHPAVRLVVRTFGATLLHLSIVETLQFGASCGRLVLSDGSFSWTIGALASARARVHVVERRPSYAGNVSLPHWVRF